MATKSQTTWKDAGRGVRGGESPHSKLGNNCEDGLVSGGADGMILTFLQRGAQQRRAPCGTQPSPKS
jgi:hypothetical protein